MKGLEKRGFWFDEGDARWAVNHSWTEIIWLLMFNSLTHSERKDGRGVSLGGSSRCMFGVRRKRKEKEKKRTENKI